MRIVLFLLCLFMSGCTGMLFQPMKTMLRTPQQIGLHYRDEYFNSADGTRLHGWWLPAEGKALGTVLLLHGNAENISTHIGSVYWLPAQHYNVFLFDYRGYGQSQGLPTLPGAILDVESAIRWLLARDDLDPKRVVVFGQSLGGALGVYALASTGLAHRVQAVILDSTFSDYHRIARDKLSEWWLTWAFQYPLSWTIDDTYSPIRQIARISPTPVLIVHSQSDHIIPVHHARDLYAAAKQPKELWIVPNGAHISVFMQTAMREKLLKYLHDVLSGNS